MRIKRMTILLPPRLRHVAQHEARRIAEAAAQQIGAGTVPANVRVELPGQGLSGHALSQTVARGVAGKAGGHG